MSDSDETGARAGPEGPRSDPDAAATLASATALARELRTFFVETLSPFEISAGEYEVLAALRHSGPPHHRASPGALAVRLGRSSGGITKRLGKLEARGLVLRAPDPEDGRSRLVSLTPEGLEMQHRVERTLVATLAARLDGLTDPDRDAVLPGVDALRRALRS